MISAQKRAFLDLLFEVHNISKSIYKYVSISCKYFIVCYCRRTQKQLSKHFHFYNINTNELIYTQLPTEEPVNRLSPIYKSKNSK